MRKVKRSKNEEKIMIITLINYISMQISIVIEIQETILLTESSNAQSRWFASVGTRIGHGTCVMRERGTSGTFMNEIFLD
jgi:hypothetical protein